MSKSRGDENSALREVMDAMYKVQRELRAHQPKGAKPPKLTVYMNHEFWTECMKRQGKLSPIAFGFHISYEEGRQKLMDAPVFVVRRGEHPWYLIYVEDGHDNSTDM